jgi:hypothetical protein
MKAAALARSSRALVFSHGNGFPGGSYRQLLQPLEQAGWRVHAIDAFRPRSALSGQQQLAASARPAD